MSWVLVISLAFSGFGLRYNTVTIPGYGSQEACEQALKIAEEQRYVSGFCLPQQWRKP